MNDVVAALGAFVVGGVAGTGILFAQGEFAPAPAPLAPVELVTQLPTLPAAPAPAQPAAQPSPPVAAAPAPAPSPAPAAPTPVPTPATPPATVLAKSPPHETEPAAPHGRLVVAGIGGGSMSVSADRIRKGAKVVVPLVKPDGTVTAHSPDGTFTLDLRYKSDGDGLKVSIDCSPMALITADGQTATHLSGVAVGKGPTRIDVKGGSTGEFSFILSHTR